MPWVDMPLPVWVRLHEGEPRHSDGSVGLVRLADVPPFLADRCLALEDPYGYSEFKVVATSPRFTTAAGVTHYTLWGGEDGLRFLAVGTINSGVPIHVRNATVSLDSLANTKEPTPWPRPTPS